MNKSKIVEQSKLPTVLAATALLLSALALGINFMNERKKIVYVDSHKLVQGYVGMKQARQEYEIRVAQWRANLDTLRSEAEVKIKEYEATKSKLSAKEKQLLEQLIQSKQEQFMNYQQTVQEKTSAADQELSSKVLAKVNDFIRRFGEKHNYKIIMAATQYGNIVYAEDESDITEEVLQGLNEEFSK